MSGNIQSAWEYGVAACKNNNIWYSKSMRTTINLDNTTSTTYCDCSSFISYILTKAGFFKSNPWFTTAESSEIVWLKKAGFVEYDVYNTKWLAGDIVWKTGHTEMVYEDAKTNTSRARTMGAHQVYIENRPKDVSITKYIPSKTYYSKLFRYGSGGAVSHWVQSDTYLNYDDMYNNAVCVYNYFAPLGFTKEAISALLGNMQRESTLNPNLSEVGGTGYGLVQWTPGSIYKNWASNKGINLNDADENGQGQCDKLNEDASKDYSQAGGQWHSTANYPEDWKQFSQLTDVEYATKVFLYNYLRAGVVAEQERINNAKKWLQEIDNFPSYEGDAGVPSIDDKKIAGIINDEMRRLVILGRH